MITDKKKLAISTLDSILLYPVFVLLLVYVFHLVASHVHNEFIDEIFHVSQCQKFCNNIFNDWNPKITTPPGLYFFGYLYALFIRLIDPSNSCGLTQLRSLNYIGGVWVLPTVLKFSGYPAFQFPITNLISFPLLTVYYCLFYTDVWSTILVILSLVVGLNEFYSVSAVLGLLSITFRQTNVVWNGFILAFIIDLKTKRKYSGAIVGDVKLFLTSLVESWKILVPFIINMVIFVGFLVYNKGITFGDKENHIAGIHIAQFFYCSTFVCIFSLPIWFSPTFCIRYVKLNFGSASRALKYIISCVFIAVIIDKFTITHPFLLADNRHYVFYIWKRLIDRTEYSRYLLTPIYHFSISTVFQLMKVSASSAEQYSFSWISSVTFVVCLCVTIIPSPLFEPRYYIIPFLIWRIMSQPSSDPILGFRILTEHNEIIRLLLEFIYFNAINAVVFYIFLDYTFEWQSEPGFLQRIIW